MQWRHYAAYLCGVSTETERGTNFSQTFCIGHPRTSSSIGSMAGPSFSSLLVFLVFSWGSPSFAIVSLAAVTLPLTPPTTMVGVVIIVMCVGFQTRHLRVEAAGRARAMTVM